MTVMGQKIDQFDVPVCNKFKPKMLEGQLCYQVDVNQVKDQVDGQKAKKHGLLFMMDLNEDKMITKYNANDLHFQPELIMEEEDKSFVENIYIETIGRSISIK